LDTPSYVDKVRICSEILYNLGTGASNGHLQAWDCHCYAPSSPRSLSMIYDSVVMSSLFITPHALLRVRIFRFSCLRTIGLTRPFPHHKLN